MDQGERTVPRDILEAVHRLVETNRLQCLWFMKEDYLPVTELETDRALSEIELHGDRQAWITARSIRSWLSQTISAGS
jgi:hypothetical protein